MKNRKLEEDLRFRHRVGCRGLIDRSGCEKVGAEAERRAIPDQP